ncbi:AAA family ATPase [Bradyrhizobium sp. 192]|uniref:AAA family ATPase n=1 Tax=Bradyrhizobium sp. 192 TaxID=2782660 RepID=UPI001FFED094|nr:AAA family ATPase [Bradyrhizobium sp. 192]UPJ55284.1 AAA family ATPase [Bradyrhizobium sp. 192]
MSFRDLRPIDEVEIPENLEMPARDKRSPTDTIVQVAFEQAMKPALRRSLSGKAGLAVIVIVPTAAWIAPCERFWKRTFGDRWNVVARDGANRSEHKSTVGNSNVSGVLADGRSVVGIATSTDVLPSTLRASADYTMTLSAPIGNTLRQVLETHFGRAIAIQAPALIGSGLDIHDLAAAFRPRSTSRQILSRLERATKRRIGSEGDDRLPSLQTAIEYGAARRFFLDLATDLKDRVPFSQLSRSVVLFGETGTGKTTLAKLVANHMNRPLLAYSVADLFARSDGALGGVVQATNAMFEMVSIQSCVFLLDELDALPDRATISSRGRDWWLPVLTNFMLRLDAAFSRGGSGRGEETIFIACTNYLDRIDSALLRPGRYEKAIEVRRPDLVGTINILSHYLPEIESGERSELGRLLEGSTGAELMMLTRDARRIARREDGSLRADDVRAVALPDEAIPPARLRRICVHEAGHAVGILVLRCAILRGIVVRTRDGAAGQTTSVQDDCDLPTRRDFEARVVATLCGRAAERLLVGEVSVGSGLDEQSDLAIATRMIASLHASTGLGDELTFTSDHHHLLKAVSRDKSLRRRVEADLVRLEKEAERLVKRNRRAIVAIAETLAEKRHLTGEAVRMLFDDHNWSGKFQS